MGTVNTKENGEWEKWISKDVGYLVKSEDFIEKMKSQLPRTDAFMDKVLKVLIHLFYQQADDPDIDVRDGEVKFYSRDIAKYFDVEKTQSGLFNKFLRRALISASYVHYEYRHKVNDANYTFHGTLLSTDIPEDNR